MSLALRIYFCSASFPHTGYITVHCLVLRNDSLFLHTFHSMSSIDRSFLGLEWPERETDHLLPSRVDMNNAWSYT